MQFFTRIFSWKPATRSSSIERPGATAIYRKIRDHALSFLGLLPKTIAIPRASCHRLTLPVKAIPKNLRASSIRLQLLNISGLSRFGFAWRVQDEEAEIWYWDESSLPPLTSNGSETPDAGCLPVPEMLRRKPVGDGFHLLICSEGFEALAIEGGQIRKTRWFSSPPSAERWQVFVRDAGKTPDHYPQPEATHVQLTEKADTNWTIDTTLLRKIQPTTWAIQLVTLITGLTIAILLAYDLKQAHLIAQQQAALSKLKEEKAAILATQQQIADNSEIPELISNARPKVLQLKLMQALAETGLFAEGTQISLMEWEFRNEKLRLMFSTPKENFSLGLFLSTLERSGILQDIRLLPETPPQTVGIQASVREIPESPAIKATDHESPFTASKEEDR